MIDTPRRYERDLRGYGSNPPDPKWPGDARIAVQFVINYEEGGENNILHGDPTSEAFLSEIIGAAPWPGQRHWNMESFYEYGARAGFWRLHRLFCQNRIPVTVYGVATALERSPEQVAAMQEAGWEIASHGLKWIEYKDHEEASERSDMLEAVRIHRSVTGEAPRGWYTGRCSVNTVRLAAEEGCFDYISDSYCDDLPYWIEVEDRAQLILPYALDTNDMRFATAQGFNSGDQFYSYLKDSFDVLYAEGIAGSAKMLNIGLHCRLAGRPGRFNAVRKFVDYVLAHEQVWVTRRCDIADHWQRIHPADFTRMRPSRMQRGEFIERFGGIFEHSPWIAEQAYTLEIGPSHDCARGLHSLLTRVFRSAGDHDRHRVLNAHPDLAGKLAAARQLTKNSSQEQAAAGLDALTDAERSRFESLNASYVEKFGFPFILAVKGLGKSDILENFELRISNSRNRELDEACRQVERIAMLRLCELFDEPTGPVGAAS